MTSHTHHPRLHRCILALRQQISVHPDGHCRLPRFDNQLFRTRGTRLADYLLEIEQGFERLQQDEQNHDRRAWLVQRLVDQIAALQREAASQQLRIKRERPQRNPREEKYLEYLEYERRLQAMIDQREQRLALAETLAVQRQLKQDLDVLEGRMARCRQAIQSVAWALSLRGDNDNAS